MEEKILRRKPMGSTKVNIVLIFLLTIVYLLNIVFITLHVTNEIIVFNA